MSQPRNKTILIVDDEDSFRYTVGRMLRALGYEVLDAENGEDGLIKADNVDVILLDLQLPKMSGVDLLKRIRESGNYTPVIVVSGESRMNERFKDINKYEIVDYLEKPCRMDVLADKVGESIRTAEDIRTIGEASTKIGEFVKRNGGGK